MSGSVKISEWLTRQPEFNEAACSKGVRFVGLCDQTLLRLDIPVPRSEKLKGVKSKFTLPLPQGFPVAEVEVEFQQIPKEPPQDDRIVSDLYNKVKTSFFFDGSDLLFLRVPITPQLLDYVHSELSGVFRIDTANPPEDVSLALWPYRYGLQRLMEFLVKQLVVYSNLCKVGSLKLKSGFVEIGDDRIETRSFHSALDQLPQIESVRGIRLLRELDFRKSWEFYAGLKGNFLGAPEKPLEIAVSNLSDLFDDSYDQSGARNLIWGFAGLEALLADSESSISSQLKQKLIALFGTQVDVEDFEKEIANIYKHRSKVVHGKEKTGSVLASLRSSFLAPPPPQKESTIAIWLLVAVIQYFFQNQKHELKFKMVPL